MTAITKKPRPLADSKAPFGSINGVWEARDRVPDDDIPENTAWPLPKVVIMIEHNGVMYFERDTVNGVPIYGAIPHPGPDMRPYLGEPMDCAYGRKGRAR